MSTTVSTRASGESSPASLAGVPRQASRRTASRQVTVTVQGVPITVECPAWCTFDHSEDLRHLEDLHHADDGSHVLVPQYNGDPEVSLVAGLAHWPFAPEGGRDPYLGLTDDGSGETAALGPAAAMAFADQLIAHAQRIRAMAKALAS